MIEVIRTQNQARGFHHISQPACEVTQFMKNFFEAVQDGNSEEINSYYANEMEPIHFSLDSERTDETITVDDHLATFSCLLRNAESRLTCVLDKSEGYWQIIHCELQGAMIHH